MPEVDGDKPKRSRFKAYPLGYFQIDLVEVYTTVGRLSLLVAIDRTTKFAFVELREKATPRVTGNFLRHLIAALPYGVHTVLTDSGTPFTPPGNVVSAASIIKEAIAAGETSRAHSSESDRARNKIDHRLTKPRHPWTNGQIEGMNRVIKDARSSAATTTAMSIFVPIWPLRRRLQLWRPPKILRGLTPYEAIGKA